jgi:hypothetical protein
LNIEGEEPLQAITIYNTLGQVVLYQQFDQAKVTIEVTPLGIAPYTVKIKWQTGEISVARLIRQ